MIIKYNGIQKIICQKPLIIPKDIILRKINGIAYISREIKDEEKYGEDEEVKIKKWEEIFITGASGKEVFDKGKNIIKLK